MLPPLRRLEATVSPPTHQLPAAAMQKERRPAAVRLAALCKRAAPPPPVRLGKRALPAPTLRPAAARHAVLLAAEVRLGTASRMLARVSLPPPPALVPLARTAPWGPLIWGPRVAARRTRRLDVGLASNKSGAAP